MYKRDHPDNMDMNTWTHDLIVPIMAMKETNSTLPLPITNAEYNCIVHLTYISAFTDKIENYIDLAMYCRMPVPLPSLNISPPHLTFQSTAVRRKTQTILKRTGSNTMPATPSTTLSSSSMRTAEKSWHNTSGISA